MTDSLFSSLLTDTPLVPVNVNGEMCHVPDGYTVAASLLYLGHRITRQHPVSDEPRAPYCHMGVCFECLVSIDGQDNQRACLQKVIPHMSIQTFTQGAL